MEERQEWKSARSGKEEDGQRRKSLEGEETGVASQDRSRASS